MERKDAPNLKLQNTLNLFLKPFRLRNIKTTKVSLCHKESNSRLSCDGFKKRGKGKYFLPIFSSTLLASLLHLRMQHFNSLVNDCWIIGNKMLVCEPSLCIICFIYYIKNTRIEVTPHSTFICSETRQDHESSPNISGINNFHFVWQQGAAFRWRQ